MTQIICLFSGYGLQQDIEGKVRFFDSNQSAELNNDKKGMMSLFPDNRSQKEIQNVAKNFSKIELSKKTEDFLAKLESEIELRSFRKSEEEKSDSEDDVTLKHKHK
jgi:hypothetical protein